MTPGLGHFVADGEKGHRFAQLIFDQARRHAGLDDAAIRLVAQRPRAQETIGDTVALITPKPLPLGTFSAHREATTITYDPALIDDPEMLIATFAHELAHVLTPPDSELPVEADEYELFTDLTSAFLGFGVFLSNTRLERYVDDGWIKWRGGGYLPVNDRIMATALFIVIKNNDQDRAIAQRYLRPHLRDTFRKAFKQLARFDPEIKRLRALDAAMQERAQTLNAANAG